VVDPNLSMPERARMLAAPGRTLIATVSEDNDVAELLQAHGAEVVRLPGAGNALDLHALLDYLATREVNEVLLETGATLSGAMLRAALIDELVVYMAPRLMGNDARGLFHLPGLSSMDDAVGLEILDIRAVGSDWRISARVAGA
jgi:diaminohydroxyphosphoribosylaminopyrimidine deaminase/5-amino-6-(5-phosphoribosylamino)uracil reductase